MSERFRRSTRLVREIVELRQESIDKHQFANATGGGLKGMLAIDKALEIRE